MTTVKNTKTEQETEPKSQRGRSPPGITRKYGAILGITGAFGEFGSVAEREVPCYLSRSFLHQVD